MPAASAFISSEAFRTVERALEFFSLIVAMTSTCWAIRSLAEDCSLSAEAMSVVTFRTSDEPFWMSMIALPAARAISALLLA